MSIITNPAVCGHIISIVQLMDYASVQPPELRIGVATKRLFKIVSFSRISFIAPLSQ
jgi:hypothetical protein